MERGHPAGVAPVTSSPIVSPGTLHSTQLPGHVFYFCSRATRRLPRLLGLTSTNPGMFWKMQSHRQKSRSARTARCSSR